VIRVTLPLHLRRLARVEGQVTLELSGPVTVRSVLDALEAQHPALRGAVRDHVTRERRPLVRFYACKEDYSNAPADTVLPEAVAGGREPFMVIGAIAGGRD
jgi:hypothetical protein